MKCVICNKDIKKVGNWEYGNNALPIADGRCCDQCNTIVIIERFKRLRGR